MQLDFGLALLIVRCLMLVAITITLGVYYDPTARRRWAVSIMATLAAGSSLGWSVFSVLMVIHQDARPDVLSELWPTLFVFCALIPVLRTRGNVAKLLPRVKWIYR